MGKGFKPEPRDWWLLGSHKLTKKALRYLGDRGISADTAVAFGLRSLTADQTADIWPDCQCESLLFPHATDYGEARIFWPTKELEAKGRKFRSATGPSRIYTPTVYFANYCELIKSKAHPKILTEGPSRVLAAAQRNMLCFSFSGCWRWQKDREPLPQLRELIGLKGGPWEIVPDADTDDNHSVALAYLTLGDWLSWAGEKAQLVHLKPVAGNRTGLDDYLRSAGKKEYRALTRHDWKGQEVERIRALSMRQTEGGLSAVFLIRHGDDVRFDGEMDRWLVYHDGIWQPQVRRALDVQEKLKETVEYLFSVAQRIPNGETRNLMKKWASISDRQMVVRGAIGLASSDPRIRAQRSDFDTDPMKMAVQNGVINLKTGELIAHDRANKVTQCMALRFEPKATCPVWRASVLAIMNKRKHMVRFMQRLLGYALIGGNAERKVAFWQGLGANGKTLLCEVLLSLFGTYGTSIKPELFLRSDTNTDAERPSPFLMSLRGMRFMTGSEFPQGTRINEAVLKRITGQDTQAVRGLHSGKDQFAVLGLVVLRYNERPKIEASDDATWQRILEVPFDRRFRGKEQDLHLRQKLLAEAPGIFNWLMEGCLEYQRQGLNEPSEVLRQGESYRHEMDSFARWFTESVTVEFDKRVKRANLFQNYTAFCMQHDQSPISDRLFYQQLRDKGFKERKAHGERRFLGLWLTSVKDARAQMKKRRGTRG